MNTWLVILDCNSDKPEIVYMTDHFQTAIDECNRLVKLYNKDYSVWLKDEWESE